MKIQDEKSVLDIATRKKIIDEIKETPNQRRKDEAYKRYQALKDKTADYVIDLILKQFDQTTVLEMQYAVTNLSIAKKVVEKLARVYSGHVKREVYSGAEVNEKLTQQLQDLEAPLCINSRMKQVNKYLKLQRNVMAYVKPMPCFSPDGSPKFNLEVRALSAHLYDVVEDASNPEQAKVVVLSDYKPGHSMMYALNAATAGRTATSIPLQPVTLMNTATDTQVDAVKSPNSKNEDDTHYIWWTDNYHFTTDGNGVILPDDSNPDSLNPIGELPFVNFAIEQDGRFWAEGGSDVADSSVRINAMLTHLNHIAVTQGYGQLFMSGKNLPKQVKVGPNHCVQLPQEEGEPEPKIGYITASPPIEAIKGLIEMYVALMLSTNNLSTSGFSASLQSGKNFASGIALMIDKAESIEDVTDQAQIFRDKEPLLWRKIAKWFNLYKSKDLLSQELQILNLDTAVADALRLTVGDQKIVLSEAEKLDLIEKRKELGLNLPYELVMMDDPSLNKEQAEAKLAQIEAAAQDKMTKLRASMAAQGGNPADPNANDQAMAADGMAKQDMQMEKTGAADNGAVY